VRPGVASQGKELNEEKKMETLHIQLYGLSPLLMHNPVGSMPTDASEQKLGRKKIPKPEDEAKAGRYLLPDGNFYVPAIAVRNSLLTGTRGQLINRRSALPYISGGVLMLDEAFPLYRDGERIQGDDYTIDTRRAVVQRQGIMRSRPRIELPWQLEAIFDYDKDIVDLNVIRAVAERAGRTVGLLDYRVERKGWFGRFEVKEIWSE
ncbi:unnamed protein product, partial [marine sediment metagenome]